MALCRRNATAACRAPYKVHAGLPREARSGLLFRLRGRPPSRRRRGRSPLNQPTNDHADGATLGRWDARASQRTRRPVSRASSGTSTGNPTRPKSPHSLGNARPTSTTLTGRLEARPHKVRPTWCGSEAEAAAGHAENRATSGCRAWLCAGRTPRRRVAPRTRSMPGSPGRRDPVCCPGNEAGRRRTIGMVAALSINPRATTPMVRRWSAGTPKRHSGPEGRCRRKVPQQQPGVHNARPT